MEASNPDLRTRLLRLREALLSQPDTVLTPLSENEIAGFLSCFPGAPEHLVALYRLIGAAELSDHGYHVWLGTPAHLMYDHVTDAEPERIVIVGHSCTGASEAYDSANNWQFGTIDETCHWWHSDDSQPTFIDFLEQRCRYQTDVPPDEASA